MATTISPQESTTPTQTRGIDAADGKRPGVPMEAQPQPDPGAHWDEPARQEPTVTVFRRTGIQQVTPVFGTAQPPRLLSGRLRALAYRIPETRARHWALLLFADRVDMTEHRLGGLIRLDPVEYRALARNMARRPVRSGLMVAGALWLGRRLLR